jgi:ribosome-associated protein
LFKFAQLFKTELMAGRKKKSETEILSGLIIKGIQDKKGKDIVQMDLTNVKNAICDSFIICHGTSRVQVEALANAIEAEVTKAVGVKPSHREGFENAEWILLDYFNVVVHVFQENIRGFYKLENLWADAEINHFES